MTNDPQALRGEREAAQDAVDVLHDYELWGTPEWQQRAAVAWKALRAALAAEPEAAGGPNDVAIRELTELRDAVWTLVTPCGQVKDREVVVMMIERRIAALRGAGEQ